jgi:hypothetical protein
MAHVGLPSVRSRPALEKDTPVTCRVQPSCLASRRQPTPKTYWARSDLQGKRLKATSGDDFVRAGARHLACGRPNATAAGRGWPRPRLNSLLAGDEASSSGLVSPPVARGRCQARQFRGRIPAIRPSSSAAVESRVRRAARSAEQAATVGRPRRGATTILQGSLRHQFLLPASRIRERSSRVGFPSLQTRAGSTRTVSS